MSTIYVVMQMYASQYFPQITELLRRLPRVILLMLKTNDCLRAVNGSLVWVYFCYNSYGYTSMKILQTLRTLFSWICPPTYSNKIFDACGPLFFWHLVNCPVSTVLSQQIEEKLPAVIQKVYFFLYFLFMIWSIPFPKILSPIWHVFTLFLGEE